MRDTRLSLALLFFLTAACVRQPMLEADFAGNGPTDEPAPEPSELREVNVASESPPGETAETGAADTAAAVPISSAGSRRAEPILFHMGAGYGVLGQLDLAPCRDHGLQTGYLHVRVTFRNSGHVVRAAVQSQVAPPPEALACIGEQLEVAMVPTFEGDDVTLSKSIFVN